VILIVMYFVVGVPQINLGVASILGDDGRNLGARPTQRRVPVADLPGDLIERRRRPA